MTNSAIAQIPVPSRADLIDAPGQLGAIARRLDDITVVAYANTTARSNAYIAASNRVPTEGTLSYLMDTDSYEYWSGATWLPTVNDSYPRGIVRLVSTTTAYPPSGATNPYVPDGAEQQLPEFVVTVSLTAARTYRLGAWFGCIDGGPGSSLTSMGGEVRLRYTASSTAPTSASTQLVAAHFQTIVDNSEQTSSVLMQKTWTCPATSTYTFAVSLYAYNSGGVRVLNDREFYVEDLGRIKS